MIAEIPQVSSLITAFGILQEGEGKPALQSLLECVRDALMDTHLHTEVLCLS